MTNNSWPGQQEVCRICCSFVASGGRFPCAPTRRGVALPNSLIIDATSSLLPFSPYKDEGRARARPSLEFD